MSRIRTTCVAMVAALAAPASAMAQHHPATLAPPGNSAVSEYLEVVPTDQGASPPHGGGTAGGSGGQQSGPLTPAQRRNLVRRGADGQALAAIVAATAPQGAVSAAGASAPGHTRASGGPGESGSGSTGSVPDGVAGLSGALPDHGTHSPLDAILAAAVGHGDGSGGLGIFLPGLMLAGVLAVIAGVAVRLRARSS